MPIIPPYNRVVGTSSNAEAINSKIPDAIRPQGSTPRVLKSATDSGLPVNLKKSVCSNIRAAKIAGTLEGVFKDFLYFVKLFQF